MLTGVVDRKSFPKVLQSIAAARRSGDLEITIQEQLVKLSFWRGKIVDFAEDSSPSVADLVERLVDAEVLPPEVPTFSVFKQLAKFCEQQGISADILKLAVNERLSDKLLSFEVEGTCPWGFRVAGVDVDLEICPGISVGQLLIDKAELDTVNASFNAKISTDEKIERGDSSGESPAELRIIDLLSKPLLVEELKRLSLLSELNFKVALLALLAKGSITVVNGAEAPKGTSDQKLQKREMDAANIDAADIVEAKDKQATQVATRRTDKISYEITPVEVRAVSLIILLGSVALAAFSWGVF